VALELAPEKKGALGYFEKGRVSQGQGREHEQVKKAALRGSATEKTRSTRVIGPERRESTCGRPVGRKREKKDYCNVEETDRKAGTSLIGWKDRRRRIDGERGRRYVIYFQFGLSRVMEGTGELTDPMFC